MQLESGFDLHPVVTELSKRRPVFHSEADFQFALAWEIKHHCNDLDVRLEIPATPGITLDLLITNPTLGKSTAVELKYKTASWTGVHEGESFRLRNHGADDLGGYDAIKDITRLETLVAEGRASDGVLVFLTNESLYWRKRADTARITNAHQFRIHEEITLSGVRSWGPNTGGSSRGRENALALRDEYPMSWHDYSDVGQRNGQFRFNEVYVRPLN